MDVVLQTLLEQYQHLKIQLVEITSATNNFDKNNYIGGGGFGPVYREELSHSKGRGMVAIKRLVQSRGQGTPEFLKEIIMLTRYKHENLISLVGFCCEGGEMILVYELASNGSLDRHLNSNRLSWTQRIKICLDAAKGISYLHDPTTTHQRLIHCDIKSGNILLDEQWNAKVSDFGLSITGSANEQQSLVVTLAAGTEGYIDPQYQMTHTLTKESDVYSFGVLLFEVLCGNICCTYSDGRVQKIFVPGWVESYKQNKIHDVVFKSTTLLPLDQSVLENFSEIAYRCLKGSRLDRPKMSEVVTVLEAAIEIQEFSEWILLFDRKKMTRNAEPPLNHSYNAVLTKHLSKRVLPNGETTFLKEFTVRKLQLENITSATNNFDDQNNRIRGGSSGKLYKGEVSVWPFMLAVKRINRRSGEGTPHFLKELIILSKCFHKNIINLVGYCKTGSEMILVYPFESGGSLDRHLSSPHLTWVQRLNICLGVAKGLNYLHGHGYDDDHEPRSGRQRIIHGDLKSSSILLDDKWNAKVAGFRLSIMPAVNELQSAPITFAAGGTPGYCDPQFAMTNTLSIESDLYSLGVVLFEVLCGTLCCTYSNDRVQQVLVPMWIESYEEKKLEDIIFKSPIIQPLNQLSLETLSDIAYRCLKESREDRPKMSEVLTELETALGVQNFMEYGLLTYYEEITKSAKPPLNYRSKLELGNLLFKGVLLNGGKTWFSINKEGEHREMISFKECLVSGPGEFVQWSSNYDSRFAVGPYHYPKKPSDSDSDKDDVDEVSGCMPCSLSSLITNAVNHVKNVSRHAEYWTLKTRVRTQFLTPGIRYNVNLVMDLKLVSERSYETIDLKFKLKSNLDTTRSLSYSADTAWKRNDGRWVCVLGYCWQVERIVDFEIAFEGYNSSCPDIYIEGIEFSPLNYDHL